MKELIFNNFLIVGVMFVILIGILLKKYDLEEKYIDLKEFIIILTSTYGALHMFDAIGKWFLK